LERDLASFHVFEADIGEVLEFGLEAWDVFELFDVSCVHALADGAGEEVLFESYQRWRSHVVFEV
jgi:hypothetical protein